MHSASRIRLSTVELTQQRNIIHCLNNWFLQLAHSHLDLDTGIISHNIKYIYFNTKTVLAIKRSMTSLLCITSGNQCGARGGYARAFTTRPRNMAIPIARAHEWAPCACVLGGTRNAMLSMRLNKLKTSHKAGHYGHQPSAGQSTIDNRLQAVRVLLNFYAILATLSNFHAFQLTNCMSTFTCMQCHISSARYMMSTLYTC